MNQTADPPAATVNTPLKAGPFFRMAGRIALPIAAQNLAHAMITIADVIMLGFIDQNALTATSLAGQFMNVLNSFFFSVTAGASVLTAQYWGKKDTGSIKKIYGIALRFSLLFALLFFVLAFFFPKALMGIYTSDSEIVGLGARYLRIIAVTYLFQGFTQVYLAVLRSIERMALPAAAYISSLILNIVLNAVFIFGLFGAPKIGLTGVAIGTVAANLLTVVICLIDSFLHKEVRLRFSCMLTKSRLLLTDMLKLSVPALFNDLGWGTGRGLISGYSGPPGRGGRMRSRPIRSLPLPTLWAPSCALLSAMPLLLLSENPSSKTTVKRPCFTPGACCWLPLLCAPAVPALSLPSSLW